MALIKCSECGKEISDKSQTCIHCGCPLSEINFLSNVSDKNEFSITLFQEESASDLSQRTSLPEKTQENRALKILKQNTIRSLRKTIIGLSIFCVILFAFLYALTLDFNFNKQSEIVISLIIIEIIPSIFILANAPDAIKYNREYKSAKNDFIKYKNNKENELKYIKLHTEIHKQKSQVSPRCPKCGSTAITTGARGVNWTHGLIGASKTVNRCGNCGHTWEPKSK